MTMKIGLFLLLYGSYFFFQFGGFGVSKVRVAVAATGPHFLFHICLFMVVVLSD